MHAIWQFVRTREGTEGGFKMAANLYQMCPFDEACHRPGDAIFRCFVSLEVTFYISFMFFRSVCVSCWWPGDGGGNNCVTYLSYPPTTPSAWHTYQPCFCFFGQLCKNKLCYIILYFCKHSYLNPRTCLSVSVRKDFVRCFEVSIRFAKEEKWKELSLSED